MRNNLVCNVYIGESSVLVKSEVDSNDITECSHDAQPVTGMLTFTDPLFSPFISCVFYCCWFLFSR